MLDQIAGISLRLWDPDEGILAEDINLRERRYGGFYHQDYFGSNDGPPTITFSTSGFTYGAKTYGFDSYAAVLGISLIEDSISTSEPTTDLTVSAFTNNTYNNGSYGFIPYLNTQQFIQDSLGVNDTFSPIVVLSNNGVYYGFPEKYGLMSYGGNLTKPIDTLTFSEPSVPTILTFVLNSLVYGDGTKYGFGVWQA